MFQFKQFAIDQSGCAMKINTDGVLLGAMANANDPNNILDIGTGTGVIALMLAQRFNNTRIDAVEIDSSAATTAGENFAASKFAGRLNCYHSGFEEFLINHPNNRYDLVVSNPPFYIHSLKSPQNQRSLAKHTNEFFLETLISRVSKCLTKNGFFWLILPTETADIVCNIAKQHNLFAVQQIEICSYPGLGPHRYIVAFSPAELYLNPFKFVIYESVKVYTAQYTHLLKDFFIIF